MRRLFFVNLLVFVSSFSFSQNITGNWSGNISVNGNQIPIVFHFYKDSLGNLNGRWDSPSQDVKNLPCSEIDVTADSITIGLKIISGFYNGKIITKDSIAGMWHQGNGQLALNISKTIGSTFEPPKRPQTPKPPYSYLSEDVVYSNADNSMKYGA